MDEQLSADQQSPRPSTQTIFRDLRRRNEYRARVARMLQAQRERHIEQVLRLQRKNRTHQAR